MTRIRFQGSLPHAGDSQPFWAPRAKERRPIFEGSVAVGRSRGCDYVAARSFGIPIGYSATGTPASSNALTFDSAVPRFPWMIAPAWPIRFPGGAVRPATYATTGFVTRRLMKSAASSSAVPPISPTTTIRFVLRSFWNIARASTMLVPMIGSPFDRLDGGVLGVRRRAEDDGGVRPPPVDGLADAVEHRDPLDLRPRFARGDPGDHFRAEVDHRSRVELPLMPRDPLDEDPALLREEDRQPRRPPISV